MAALRRQGGVEHVPYRRLCTLNRTSPRESRLGIARQINRLRRRSLGDHVFPKKAPPATADCSLPFKGGAARGVRPTPVLVQPVRIDYGDATRELAWVGDELRSRSCCAARYPTLRFCDPFDRAIFPVAKAIAAEGARAGGWRSGAGACRRRDDEPKTFHVKSFGCQTSVGERDGELLRRRRADATADRRRSGGAQHLSHSRKGDREVYSDIGRRGRTIRPR